MIITHCKSDLANGLENWHYMLVSLILGKSLWMSDALVTCLENTRIHSIFLFSETLSPLKGGGRERFQALHLYRWCNAMSSLNASLHLDSTPQLLRHWTWDSSLVCGYQKKERICGAEERLSRVQFQFCWGRGQPPQASHHHEYW